MQNTQKENAFHKHHRSYFLTFLLMIAKKEFRKSILQTGKTLYRHFCSITLIRTLSFCFYIPSFICHILHLSFYPFIYKDLQ